MAEIIANNALTPTTLSAGINAIVTTIPVAFNTGYPIGSQFRVQIGNEIIIVPATASGTSWAGCTRGAEGTTAASHSSGVTVNIVLTAAGLTAVLGTTFTSSAQGPVPASGGGTTNFLRADGTWNAPAGGGGGSLVFLGSRTASSSATLDFTSLISSTYDEYFLEIVNLVSSTSGNDFGIQFSTNNGSTWNSTDNEAIVWLYCEGGTGTYGGSGITSFIAICPRDDNTSNWSFNGRFRIYNPLGSGFKFVSGEGVHKDSTFSGIFGYNVSGSCKITTACNAFRIMRSAGNIVSGTARLYGISKS